MYGVAALVLAASEPPPALNIWAVLGFFPLLVVGTFAANRWADRQVARSLIRDFPDHASEVEEAMRERRARRSFFGLWDGDARAARELVPPLRLSVDRGALRRLSALVAVLVLALVLQAPAHSRIVGGLASATFFTVLLYGYWILARCVAPGEEDRSRRPPARRRD